MVLGLLPYFLIWFVLGSSTVFVLPLAIQIEVQFVAKDKRE